MRYAAVAAYLCSIPAFAQDGAAMTGAAFDAYVTGKTLSWSWGEQPWGIEEYLPGRRVQWATSPQDCQIGEWYEQDGQICFQYEGREIPSCWIFRQGATGLTADLQGSDGPLLLNETGQSQDGVPCPGPMVGV